MLAEALLAWLHYLAIFVLIVALAAQAVLLRPAMNAGTARRLAAYDRLYLVAALAALATGLLRLTLGAKGMGFYGSNPWFHAKMTLFVVIALCSVAPTRIFLRWRRQAAAQADFVPANAEIARARRWVMIESHLIVLLPLFAALMARGVSM